MTKGKQVWVTAASAAILAVLPVIAGCSSGNGNSSSVKEPSAGTAAGASSGSTAAATAKDQKAQAPTEIKIMNVFYSKEPPSADNPLIKADEKLTNTKLNISWVSPNSYLDKANVVLASGDIPDLMLITQPFASNVTTMMKQGAFWDLTPYFKDYPNLMKIPQTIYDTLKVNGKNYGVPDPRPLEGNNFVMYRQDWLDKLHLKTPETIDDYYKVMKAFTEQDPDGNGKKDTYGFVGDVTSTDMNKLRWVEDTLNGTYGRWKLQGDKLIDTTFEPGTREAILWWKKVYEEGLMPADFAVLKQTQITDMLQAGKAGVSHQSLNAIWGTAKFMMEIDPKADYVQATYVSGPFGKIYPLSSGFFGINVIPKTVPEAKMKAILKFLDTNASEEGHTLLQNGIENVDYTVKDGIKVATPQAQADNISEQIRLSPFYDKYSRTDVVGIPQPIKEKGKKLIDEQSKYGITNPSIGLQCPTCDKVGVEYDKKIQDLKIKIIMNKEPIEAWDKLLAELKNDPQMKKMAEEMNASYQEKHSAK